MQAMVDDWGCASWTADVTEFEKVCCVAAAAAIEVKARVIQCAASCASKQSEALPIGPLHAQVPRAAPCTHAPLLRWLASSLHARAPCA